MSLKLYEETSIQAIATAIRAKNGSSDTYTVGQMANAIENIPSGGDTGSWVDVFHHIRHIIAMKYPRNLFSFNSLNNIYTYNNSSLTDRFKAYNNADIFVYWLNGGDEFDNGRFWIIGYNDDKTDAKGNVFAFTGSGYVPTTIGNNIGSGSYSDVITAFKNGQYAPPDEAEVFNSPIRTFTGIANN